MLSSWELSSFYPKALSRSPFMQLQLGLSPPLHIAYFVHRVTEAEVQPQPRPLPLQTLRG